MNKTSVFLALALLMGAVCAQAEPGDEASVASAQKYYEKSMQGNDVGLQAAMKNALDFQLRMAKKRKGEVSTDTKSDSDSKPDKAAIKS